MRWRSGGLCIIYSERIANFLTHIESKCDMVQWLKINKLLTGTDKDVMLGNTYIPPGNTNYYNATAFQDLQEELIKFNNNIFCIAGDLNSHSGTVRDYVEIEDFTPEHLNFDSDSQEHLNNIIWLQNNGINLNRENQDQKRIDAQGKQLIEFCKTNSMFICNGRLDTDPTGKATTSQGSLIDYVLASPIIICKIKQFSVHNFDGIFSDKHCRVSWNLMCNRPTQNNNKTDKKSLITIKKTHRSMWTSDKSVAFSDQLNINEVNNIRESLANDSTDVNLIIDKIQALFEHTANIVLGYEREYQVDANAKRKPIKFDRNTLNARNRYYKARRENDGTHEKQKVLTAKSKIYKKAVSKALALHKKRIINKLRNAKTRNPKFYW